MVLSERHEKMVRAYASHRVHVGPKLDGCMANIKRKLDDPHPALKEFFGDSLSREFFVAADQVVGGASVNLGASSPLTAELFAMCIECGVDFSGAHQDALTSDEDGVALFLRQGTIGRTKVSKILTKSAKDVNRTQRAIDKLVLARKAYENRKLNGYRVKISIDPLDFLRLGFLQSDQNSCFTAGSQSAQSAIILSREPKAFVVYVSKNDQPWQILGRSWGMTGNSHMVLTNVYPNKTGEYRNLMNHIQVNVAKLMGFPTPNSRLSSVFEGDRGRRGIYSNGDARVFSRNEGTDSGILPFRYSEEGLGSPIGTEVLAIPSASPPGTGTERCKLDAYGGYLSRNSDAWFDARYCKYLRTLSEGQLDRYPYKYTACPIIGDEENHIPFIAADLLGHYITKDYKAIPYGQCVLDSVSGDVIHKKDSLKVGEQTVHKDRTETDEHGNIILKENQDECSRDNPPVPAVHGDG